MIWLQRKWFAVSPNAPRQDCKHQKKWWGSFFLNSHSTINDLVCIKNIACGRCSAIQHTMTRLDLLRLEHFSRMCTWQVGGNIYFICIYVLKYHSRGCRLVKRGSVGPNKDFLFLYYPPQKGWLTGYSHLKHYTLGFMQPQKMGGAPCL